MVSLSFTCFRFVQAAFRAEEGNTLVVADYGQLELRLLAHITNCESMITAFKVMFFGLAVFYELLLLASPAASSALFYSPTKYLCIEGSFLVYLACISPNTPLGRRLLKTGGYFIFFVTGTLAAYICM